jgi:uncharacterized protein involved in copper resistance
MVVALVSAEAAVRLGQLDPVAFDMVDGADRDAVGADHLHMLANIVKAAHRLAPFSSSQRLRTPYSAIDPRGTAPPTVRSFRHKNRGDYHGRQ